MRARRADLLQVTPGRLAQTPLTEVLATLLAQRSSGALLLTEQSGRASALTLTFGVVTKARTAAIVLDHPNPSEVVAQHIEWAAERLGTTSFEFVAGLDVIPEEAAVATLPLASIWRSARHAAHAARVSQYLARFGNQPVALHRRARLDLFALDADELASLRLLRNGRVPFSLLLGQPAREPLALHRLVYVLALCRHLDVGDGREPLGIDGPEALLARPFVSSRPPRAPVTVPPAEAHQRKLSGVVHRQPGAAPSQQTSPLGADPEAQLSQALVLAARYEFDRALPLAELAAVKKRGDSACGAFVAYLRVRCGKFNDRRAETELDLCHRAIREHPETSQLRYYRAWVLKAMGREEEAMRDFGRVLRDDPHHVDAARELHLHARRQTQTASGFLAVIRRSLTPASLRARPPANRR